MKRLRLALLCGGDSAEREVSLSGARQVTDALDKERYEVVTYDPKTDLQKLVADAPGIDAALIILHGPNGEDGTVQGLLDLLKIPYQGAGVLGSATAMNKLASKRLYREAGLNFPEYRLFRGHEPLTDETMTDCVEALGLPLVVKPVCAGSSVGMAIVREAGKLQPAVETAFRFDNAVMVERYIAGTELTVGVLGNENPEALPVIEIVPTAGYEFFDYEAKYKPGATDEICPARIDEALTAKVQKQAITAHQALFCQGYSRSDFILKDGTFYILETNTIPGMTATSLFPQAAAKAGIPFGELLDRLIQLGMEAHRAKATHRPTG